MKETYAQTASYRCMNYPGTQTFEIIPVFSEMGSRGQISDDQVLAAQEALKDAIKKGFSIINGSFCCKPGFLPVFGHVSHVPIAA